MIAACLLFDRNYSTEGWLCCRSIHEHAPSTRIYVLCLDEAVMEESRRHRVTGIPLRAMERRFPALEIVRKERQWAAYTQTCKVFLPTCVFESFGEKSLCYVDSDMYFWGGIGEVELALGNSSFMVASRENPGRLLQGEFNGGFFACRNDNRSRRFFEWWQERVIEWCEWWPGPGGRFTEEGYLNIIADEPDRFHGMLVCPHPGINLAWWNAMRHDVRLADGGRPVIDGRWNLVCFHYQGFDADNDMFGLGAPPEGALRFVYEKYRDELQAALRR